MGTGSLTRARALRGLPELIGELGGDGPAMFARFRIPVAAVDGADPDALVPTRSVARVLETAAGELSCPDLGLRLAERQGPEILGPLAVAVQNSATLGAALECASRYLYVHSPVLTVGSVPDPEDAPGVTGLEYGSTDPMPPQVADLGVGVLHRIVRLLAGGAYGLRSVHLPHPRLTAPERYRAFFDAEVRFDRPAAVLRVPADLVRRPLAGGDETVRAIAIDYLETHFDRPGRTVADRVRTAVDRSLGSGPVRVGSVARLLRVHPRTLQRHLAAEDTTFERIVDEARRDLAERLITRTDLPFSQVAGMVGLAEQSALTRSSRRWFGSPPRELRRQA
ncbi:MULTISPECIES: AraC family transcriptional regulator [Pseudonocardia]|uniref:HTH-type transcriptional regulator VirS n=2 Tax=Pseudonocardia TaxID=1847 RepID=A0A1Y2N6Z7_PSEAH|nr:MULTISPECIES: AraC family transcriptional regulator [Pseudonocardia]OSY43244.1 HTH-type transcriptional regulator VirS [Pseudonocardia autotrophica]TDN71732.1 AraC-like DNA-binding protein [Pseudonocardia autotrophica]BBG02419.1 HTH-type transcriptional regulator VirS [Pseudonocardia autotrophica]GEC23245.1 HTH-type transcriptional regulator VirS [Pseudonocardia saturnea]